MKKKILKICLSIHFQTDVQDNIVNILLGNIDDFG